MNRLDMKNPQAMSYACAEAINTLCTNISFLGDSAHRIMFTSSHAGEGKSYVSMNVARTMAKLGKKVVFVDADLRRSMIDSRYHFRYQDEAHRSGLSHFLAGMAEREEIVYETNVPNLYVVPIGRTVSNSLALLVSPRFEKLLKDICEIADYVIVDAPPIGQLIDAAEIARSCDGTLLVVNYNSVRRQELLYVKDQLEQTGTPILGTVLNGVEFDSYVSKKYYYRAYYSRYEYESDSKEGGKKKKRGRKVEK